MDTGTTQARRKAVPLSLLGCGQFWQRLRRGLAEPLFQRQRQSLNIPGNAMDGAIGGEDGRFTWGEGQPHETLAGGLELGLALVGYPNDAAVSHEHGSDL